MIQHVDSGEVNFVHLADVEVLPGHRSAVIAKFPAPVGCGRVHGARPSGGIDRNELLGESPEMMEVASRLIRFASSQAAVMLVGESGTGKEVAARMLHAHSGRADGPFVAVNCGAIPANLVEAELFGYERGAFTGAVRQHQGYFERAAGGTLFLDEITEMPVELQAKLLRVLESGCMVRVGGGEEIAVDARIVTATNRPPEDAVRDRCLREDLFYRLAVFQLRLPPLREREGDIDLLAQHFLDRLNAAYGTRKRLARGALALARTHCWPGNVRELKNCVERSFVLCDERVELDLSPVAAMSGAAGCTGECVHVPVGTTMAEAERGLLLATLRACGGNKRRTAEMLGVSLKTVYNKLVGYGVASPLLRAAGDG